MFQDKAQTAENGMSFSRAATPVLGHLGTSLRASWEAVVRGVAPLDKDQAIACEARLRQLLPALLYLLHPCSRAVNHFPTR